MRIAIAHARTDAAAALRELVAADPDYALAWTAASGESAVAQCRRDRPDLLLLDLALPDIDAASATRRIMAASPCAILVTGCDSLARAPYAALAAGALDSVCVPSHTGPANATEALADMRRKLHQMLQILRSPAPASARSPARPAPAPVPAPNLPLPGLLVIGASTGGPAVIAELLRSCRSPLAMPCVLVQHIDAEFAVGMAAWLAAQTGQCVVLAEPGQVPQAGRVYLGRGPGHLVLDRQGRFAERHEPVDYPYRPSIDEFFGSVAALARPGCALVLTGMGRDGARGLAELRRRGWSTIVQTPASCAAPGMPQAAIDAGAAQSVLDVAQIAAALNSFTSKPTP